MPVSGPLLLCYSTRGQYHTKVLNKEGAHTPGLAGGGNRSRENLASETIHSSTAVGGSHGAMADPPHALEISPTGAPVATCKACPKV